jgi:hypothetical protein
MFFLEGRRSPRALKLVMKACEEICSAILDFLKVFYNFPKFSMVILNLGLDLDPWFRIKKPRSGSGSGFHDCGSKTLLRKPARFC